MTDAPKTNRKWLIYFLDFTLLLTAIAIGLMVRNGLYETTIIISGSMRPTLNVDDRFLVDHRSSLQGKWQRGDIILFSAPQSWGEDPALVKRVIGLPGEKAQLYRGAMYINGKKLSEPYVRETPDEESGNPIVLANNQYFVAGDNRNNSDDSRANGPIEEDDIQGRLVFQLSPFSQFGRLNLPQYDF